MCTHSRLLTLVCVCISANSTSEEGDPVSERGADHGDRTTERRPANCGGDPEVCHFLSLDSSSLQSSQSLNITYILWPVMLSPDLQITDERRQQTQSKVRVKTECSRGADRTYFLPQDLGLYNMYVCVCAYNDVTSVSQSSQDSADVYIVVLRWPCQPSRMFTVRLRPREERQSFFGP